MGQYLKLFRTSAEYSGSTEKPPVSHIIEDVNVIMEEKVNNNGHCYTDLGLPSGNLWACYNVGASDSSICGGYIQWSEIITGETNINYFKRDNMRYWDSSIRRYTKYERSDWKRTLELEDDAARVIMGGDWETPDVSDYDELKSNCTSGITEINGLTCATLTGSNGNTIAFPLCGFLNSTYASYGNWEYGIVGYYWTKRWSKDGEQYPDDRPSTYVFNPSDGYYKIHESYDHRHAGLSVRGIIKVNS